MRFVVLLLCFWLGVRLYRLVADPGGVQLAFFLASWGFASILVALLLEPDQPLG